MPETIPFTLHARAIRFLVTHQSGTVQKAILEAVMNSIDAGATRVDVNIGFEQMEITDNGKGFASREEILEYFATFCAPHQEGDARYGRFRMGRGQLFNLGPNRWRSGEFLMEVDFTANDDDAYTFKLDTLTPIQGTRIDIAFRDTLNAGALMAVTEELRTYLIWTETEIYVNGERISSDVAKAKWDLETPDFFFKATTSEVKGISVYNQGVLVCEIPKHRFGIGGTLVSRRALDVNFARNEILSTCKTFKAMAAAIKKHAGTVIEKQSATLDPSQRAFMARQIVTGETTWAACGNAKLFKDSNGRSYSETGIGRLRWTGWATRESRVVFSFADDGDKIADRLLESKMGFVLSRQMLEFFNVKAPAQFMKRVRVDEGGSLFVYVPLAELSRDVSDQHDIIPEASCTARETGILAGGLRYLSDRVSEIVAMYKSPNSDRWMHRSSTRTIRLGKSDVADGWTDGSGYIAINREFLRKVGTSETAFARLALLILHEYCHDGDDRSTHTHSPEFYSQYEHLSDQVVSLAATAYNGYVNSITQSAKRLTKQQAKAALRNKQAKHVEATLDTLAAD